MKKSKVMISILCATYNHKKFIDDAISSFLRQKTKYIYEIIISDDASPDGTGEYLKIKYGEENPNIKIFLHEKNMGARKNAFFAFTKCSGKYIMICEGDDYWVDDYKIDKQVNFLEKNPDYFGCFTLAQVHDKDFSKIIPYNPSDINGVKDFLLRPYQIPTCTMAFRNEFRGNIFTYRHLLGSTGMIGDVMVDMVICDHGKYKFINDVTGCYRVASSKDAFSAQVIDKVESQMLETRNAMRRHMRGKYGFQFFISTSLVYASILTKYSKKSLLKCVQRYIKIPFQYKIGSMIAVLIIARDKYFANNN